MAVVKDILISQNAMSRVDQLAAESGLSSQQLMENAGSAVAAAALRHYPQALRFIVLCGPGNNGGDGYVAARYLQSAGAEVHVYSICDAGSLKGDAAWAHSRWFGAIAPMADYHPKQGDVIIDALFGAGLSRALPFDVAELIAEIGEARLDVIAVDLPSGINGLSGVAMGAHFSASHVVTFAALKPAHLLLPGRDACGCVELVDIGIPDRIIRAVAPEAQINHPSLWVHLMPRLGASSHKYKRGHLTVFSGKAHSSGAARMTARAALNAGAGIIVVAAPDTGTSNVIASHLTAIMQVTLENVASLDAWLVDPRHECFVIGPGYGDLTRLSSVLARISDRGVVLDADALTAISKSPGLWFDRFAASGVRIMTPHEGEFARVFPDIAADASLNKIDKAKAAAQRSHSVVIYKGADSVIAAPDGRVVVNANAPASLATAGSGDVLAGVCGALLAQSVPAFEAACAAVWMHGEAAKRGPSNLNAEQLAELVLPYAR